MFLGQECMKSFTTFLRGFERRQVADSVPADRNEAAVPHQRPAVPGGRAIARSDPPVPMFPAVERIEDFSQVVQRLTEFCGSGNVSTGAHVTAPIVGRLLKHFQEMKSLIIAVMIVVQLVGEEQTEVLVAPSEVAHIGCRSVEGLLQPFVAVIAAVLG
jgi:hypothetical protein